MDDFDKTLPRNDEQMYSKTMPGKRDRELNGRFEIGDLIMKRYKVLSELGQGGMGVVYKCFDETAGIEVALKALPPELSHNTVEMEDIKDNFQLVHNLHHPNIASSNQLERDDINGNYYLIMENCEGEDLRRWIKRKRKEGPLPQEEILSIIKQVACALDYAHKQKIIHRDIKPGNIMINAAGDIKVLDFGLAAQIHTSMTRVSMAYHGTSGTGPYMAPEQWRGRAQGAAADQYALAVMTYEMFAGHLPFQSADAAVLQQAVLTQEAEKIPNISKSIQSAINRAMKKDPAQRFDSCADFVAALTGKKIKAAKIQKKSGLPTWAAALIIAVLLGAGTAGFYYNKYLAEIEQKKKIAEEAEQKKKIAEEAEQKKKDAEELEKKFALLMSEAEVEIAKIDRSNYDRGQTFGEKIDQMHNHFNASKNTRITKIAVSFLEKSFNCINWIKKNAPLRLEAQNAHKILIKQKQSADKSDAGIFAEAIYQSAEKKLIDGQKMFRSGQFYQAKQLFQTAGKLYAESSLKSNKNKVSLLLRKIDQTKDLNQIRSMALDILKIDEKNLKAKKILENINKELLPRFEIDCTVQGKKVTPECKTLKTAPKSEKWPRLLEKGKEYLFELTYKNADGVVYQNKLNFVCNWDKTKKFRVKLEKQTPRISDVDKGKKFYQKGKEFFTNEQYAEALKWYKKAADLENPEAQYDIGELYWNGKGVKQDYAEAVKWYKKAAELGNATAQNDIGWCYQKGYGVKQDYAEALKWYRKAAEKGNITAPNNIGWLYQNGYGVKQDYAEAVKWYKKAAELGNATAQYNIGNLYWNGRGVKQDYAEAVKWYKKAAELGNATAQNDTGWCYQNGYGVKQDYAEALKWYRKAAELGNATAQNNIGWLYQKGYGVKQDYAEAVKWYRKAAELGNDAAQNNIGWLYQNGYGVKQDYAEALKWYKKAADLGNASAQNNIGWLYQNGYGVKKDYAEAVKWYRNAAEKGNSNAQDFLGDAYFHGNGVPKDLEQAAFWYYKAAIQGNKTAKESLEKLGEPYKSMKF